MTSASSLAVAEIEQLFLRMTQRGDIGARAELMRRLPELQSLADRGNADAQALAGGLFLEHLNRLDDARRYFGMAAEQGHPGGRRGLGFMLLNGSGGDQDPERAIDLLTAAVADGDGFAAYNLGVLFRKGDLVPVDESRARLMFQRAAELGLGAGAAALASGLADDGQHVQAREWNRRGADAGSIPAMFALACACRDGIGGPVDRVEAVRWFLKMLDWGDTRGVAEAVQLAASMSKEDVRRAARLAGREADAEALIQRASRT